MDPQRVRYLPGSLGLGLFVGDVATLTLRGELTVARAVVSGLVSLVVWLVTRRLVHSRLR